MCATAQHNCLAGRLAQSGHVEYQRCAMQVVQRTGCVGRCHLGIEEGGSCESRCTQV